VSARRDAGDGAAAQVVALAALTARCEAAPEALPEIREVAEGLAEGLGGEPAFAWWQAALRATLALPPDGDAVRELYGALVDRYRDEPARLAALRPLGDEIRRREADGSLPSTLVARSSRKRKRPPGD
jgi:hypothetical protein